MAKFPVDARLNDVISAFERLGFRLIRQGNHISMLLEKADGTRIPLTIPNHRRIKGSTLRNILSQVGITREQFLNVFFEK
jgi:predicted RNA binding protein YcfA (HicA-like mRNA interferase family)